MTKNLINFLWAALFASAAVGGAQTPMMTAEGFAVPQAGKRFEFPRDHGSHPEFKIEWWYVTGHLFTEGGRRFGYQATFFRSAAPDRKAQLFLAHMALLDVRSGQFYHQERLNRAGWDATSAQDGLDVRNGPWRLRMSDAEKERMELRGGVRAEVAFELSLVPQKPLVVFGENGVSKKGAEATAASYYLTFPRLRTEGKLTVGEETLSVTGLSWMDHEISSSQLGAEQVGWDWVSVQFNDGRELMLYRLRRRDGSADPASTLTWVGAGGVQRKSAFEWEVLERWKSAVTGASYPSRVRLRTTDPETGKPVEITLEPLAKVQELTGSVGGIAYWEGACRVVDEGGKEVGSAFMELTGYAGKLEIR